MRVCRPLIFCAALACCAPVPAVAGELFDAALPELGATAQGTKAKFNKDWPASGALINGKKSGTIFDPFEGATIEIRLIESVEIEAVEITGLDYRNSRQISGVDIFIDGREAAHADLPENPGKAARIPVAGKGQYVRIVATGGHPARAGQNGKRGPEWGGFGKIAVLGPTDLAARLALPREYGVSGFAPAVAETAQSAAKPSVEVKGEPRVNTGHPRTLWDSRDIAHLRALLPENPVLAKQYDALKASMDALLGRPPTVPEPVRGPDGGWTHLPSDKVGKTHNALALKISDLGTVYALSGEEKYADYAKKLLLAYADAFDKYVPGNRPGFSHDQGKLFDQRLSDATWLIPVARGYDLIFNSPGISPAERAHIEGDLLKAAAKFIMANSSMLRSPTNWSAIATASVLITGYATDDRELTDAALYGIKGSKDQPAGGVMLHFGEKSINSDGLWAEGAIGYQFMAMQALVADAEILWRNGVDMYRYHDGALKKLFDSPIAYSFPDLKTPSVHDSGSVSIVGRESYLYEYAYLRYGDPRYLLILNDPSVSTRLDTRFQQFPVSVLYGRDPAKQLPPIEWLSENFDDVGYGILRNTSGRGAASLLLDYGPNRSHGHPDKLNIDLWTSKTGRLIPDPGMVWYEQPLYRNWFRTSLAHNTLTVDERDQVPAGGNLLVYGFAASLAMQRANSTEAVPGVIMDRAVFLTPEYLADIFGAFGSLPRKFDLAWHIRGEFSTSLPLRPFAFPEPRERGYSELANTASAQTEKPWDATFDLKDSSVRFHAAGGDTEVITGDGWYGGERPKTIIQRRLSDKTIFGNAVDFSGEKEGFVKSVGLEGTLSEGRALLAVETAAGTDLCFVSYRPGVYSVGGIKTDAAQAFVRKVGGEVVGAMLGGGKYLEVGGEKIALAGPGMAALEKVDGNYLLTNLSPVPAEISLSFAALEGREVYPVDRSGKREGPPVPFSGTARLEGGRRLEFSLPGTPGIFESRNAVLLGLRKAEESARQAEKNAARARSDSRAQEAAARPVPGGIFIVLQAEDFVRQGGGEVAVAQDKTAHLGSSLSKWNGEGHWLEWEAEVPADGYYNLSLCYCSEANNGGREIVVNGENQEPDAPFLLPATGGYSNGRDDWQLETAADPFTRRPLLVKFRRGKNTVRLTNANGLPANLDYLVISAPDVNPSREKAAEITSSPAAQKAG